LAAFNFASGVILIIALSAAVTPQITKAKPAKAASNTRVIANNGDNEAKKPQFAAVAIFVAIVPAVFAPVNPASLNASVKLAPDFNLEITILA
jgi:hypothetical protein